MEIAAAGLLVCVEGSQAWGAHHGQSVFNTARYSSKVKFHSPVRQDAKNKVHGQKYFRHRRDVGFVANL